jgi:adenine-specific DNA-methyltransferase
LIFNPLTKQTKKGKHVMSDCLNRFHLGDCTKIMPTLPSGSVDFILTDPPYLVNYRSRDGRRIAGDVDDSWLQPAFDEMYRVLRPDRFAVSFYGWGSVDKFMAAWRKAGFRIVGHFVFAKHYASRTGYTEARHECAYLLAKGTPQAPECAPRDVMPWGKYTGNRLHPTQKPAEMLAPLISAYSQIGDTVLDPFAGSGSTLIAAKQLRRAWIGIETDETYYRNAAARVA